MSEELKSGVRIKTIDGKTVVVQKRLGGGGQGDVYLVDYNKAPMALKWYKNGVMNNPAAFRQNLIDNKEHGAPSAEFLWPVDVTEWSNGTFGYIMPLKPSGFYEVSEFMLTNVRFKSYKTAIDVALKIVSAYRLLHNDGYSYQDLNDGNFFINPQNGKVLICDNDNVAPDKTETGIIGKPRYMAPEIVAKKNMPNSLSDLFSMSVILFILFCMTHPLEGKRSLEPCLSPALQEKLYGSEALFIMDPTDRSNGPHPIVHKNVNIVWPCLPKYMQDLFLKAFSQKALTNPNARPKELEWIQNLVRFRSEIVQCSCGNEVFTQDGKPCVCEKCHKKISIPFRLEFDDYSIPGLPDSRIYRCQLGVCRADEALKPMGRVIAKKDTPGMLGVRNLSDKSWNAVTPSGKAKHVMPDEVIPLKDGISFVIGDGKINIKSN